MKVSMRAVLAAGVLSTMALSAAPAMAGGESRLTQVQSRPSFNCQRARTRVERMICGDAYLGRLDRQMAQAYAALQTRLHSSQLRTLRADQRSWLADRNACVSVSCLTAVYEDRINELDSY